MALLTLNPGMMRQAGKRDRREHDRRVRLPHFSIVFSLNAGMILTDDKQDRREHDRRFFTHFFNRFQFQCWNDAHSWQTGSA
jgi:hypothetical protein